MTRAVPVLPFGNFQVFLRGGLGITHAQGFVPGGISCHFASDELRFM
jgi:hypothetical protein